MKTHQVTTNPDFGNMKNVKSAASAAWTTFCNGQAKSCPRLSNTYTELINGFASDDFVKNFKKDDYLVTFKIDYPKDIKSALLGENMTDERMKHFDYIFSAEVENKAGQKGKTTYQGIKKDSANKAATHIKSFLDMIKYRVKHISEDVENVTKEDKLTDEVKQALFEEAYKKQRKSWPPIQKNLFNKGLN